MFERDGKCEVFKREGKGGESNWRDCRWCSQGSGGRVGVPKGRVGVFFRKRRVEKGFKREAFGRISERQSGEVGFQSVGFQKKGRVGV